ncbi:MAG: isoprenylcysteine carboxylmethyltransferase family protein [Elusimicrobia bacterium]|nr:isoprenylcysteine carboxylmethyltransferase family protein [Elusimicrobiota bacterium]
MNEDRRRKLTDLAYAAPLAAWYAWNGSRGLPGLLAAARGLLRDGGTVLAWARAASQLSSIAFCGFLVAVLAARRPPLSVQPDWRPRLVAFLGTFAALGFARLPPARLTAPWAVASAVLVCVGFALSLAVLAGLGRSFSVVPEARGLVTTGPYALVRHPLYLVEQLALLGVCLQYAQPWSALMLAAQFALQLARIRYEERVLAAAFPAEYPAYAARVARLIPGLY